MIIKNFDKEVKILTEKIVKIEKEMNYAYYVFIISFLLAFIPKYSLFFATLYITSLIFCTIAFINHRINLVKLDKLLIQLLEEMGLDPKTGEKK